MYSMFMHGRSRMTIDPRAEGGRGSQEHKPKAKKQKSVHLSRPQSNKNEEAQQYE